MQPSTLFLALSTLALSQALPSALKARNDRDDPFYMTWWENGCAVDGDANQSTFLFTTGDDNLNKPGDCIPVPLYNWQSVQVTQDSDKSYSVDLFSGEGCDGLIKTVTENGCYTQPEGQSFLSARVNLAG